MNEAKELFVSMRMNIKMAEKHFEAGNFALVDYYLGLLSKNITTVRKLYGRKPCESAESSDGS